MNCQSILKKTGKYEKISIILEEIRNQLYFQGLSGTAGAGEAKTQKAYDEQKTHQISRA